MRGDRARETATETDRDRDGQTDRPTDRQRQRQRDRPVTTQVITERDDVARVYLPLHVPAYKQNTNIHR